MIMVKAYMACTMFNRQVLALFLLLAANAISASVPAYKAQDADVASVSPQQQFGDLSNFNFTPYLPEMALDSPRSLPCRRPAQYKYPSLVPGSYTKTQSTTTGIVSFSVAVDGIQNVTPAMIVYMWKRLTRKYVDPRSPKGPKYQLFQLLHPSDNNPISWNTSVLSVAQDGPGIPGSEPTNTTTLWVWSDVPGSGCSCTNTTCECPDPQPGYTCKTPKDTLAQVPTLNLTMWCNELSNQAITMSFFLNVQDTGLIKVKLWRAFVQVKYIMKYRPPKANRPGSLKITTNITVGYDNAIARPVNEKFIVPLWTRVTGGNWEQAAMYWILHYTQVWGSLSQWLPQWYAAVTNTAAPVGRK